MQSLSTNASISLAQKSLDALWSRQQAISDNIANQDTPGYKSKTVLFEDILQDALELTGKSTSIEKKILSINPELKENDAVSMGEDGNGVDADAENIALVRTQLQYQAMVQSVSGEISRMSYVLNGGK